MPNQLYNPSGSLQEQLGTPKINYDVKGDERVIAVLVRELDALKGKVHDLETKKIIDETHLPLDILEENKMIPFQPRKVRRGKAYRPILKSEIEEAKKHTVNEASASRWLGIGIETYKKYAKLYGIWDPKPCIRGKRGIVDPYRGKHPLKEILEGKHPGIDVWTVKDKLIRSGLKKLECEVCGFNQRRTGDNKVCLLLNHMDGDVHNHKFENLKLMCLNCTFLAGRGYIRRSKFSLDPDWMQDMEIRELKKGPRY